MKMTPETMSEARELLMPQPLKQLITRLRYQGGQYRAGSVSRGGLNEKHFLEEAADDLDRLFARTIELGEEVADLRNVVQAACIGGIPSMMRAWEKYFPDHPISVSAALAGGVDAPQGQSLPEFQEVSWGVDAAMRPIMGMAISEFAFREWCKANRIALSVGVPKEPQR